MRVNPNFSADMVNLMDQAQQAEDNAAEQLSTGRRVNLPSDDPAAEAAMVAKTRNPPRSISTPQTPIPLPTCSIPPIAH